MNEIPIHEKNFDDLTRRNGDGGREHYLKEELDRLINSDSTVFGFLQQASLDGLWYWDLEAPRHEWMSARFWEVLGYDPATKAHLADEWQDIIFQEDLPAAIENLEAHCADPAHPYDQIVRYRHADGGTVWVRCRGIAIRGPEGKPIRMLGAHNDVTPLKRVEEQLRQRELTLTALLAESNEANTWLKMAEQIAHVGHWRVTLPDYGVTWSNEIYHIHGLAPEAFTPTIETAIAFYHPDDRQHVQDAIRTAVETKAAFEFVLRIVRRDGEIRHVQCRGVTTVGPDGSVAMLFGVFVDVTEQRQIEAALRAANKRLDEMAYIDGLTEVPNRRKFDEDFDRAWRASARAGDMLSVALLDVDHFKAYNDLYGHQAGDDCLRRIAAAITSAVQRPYDLVARYGGEEFIMLLPATDAEAALALAEAARAAVEGLAIDHAKAARGKGIVSVSIGVACAAPADAARSGSKEGLVAEADAMLYEAKRTGRDKVMSQARIDTGGGVPLPVDEEARLMALASYERRGATLRTPELDRIARMAATLMGAPIALVSLVGKDEQSFAGNFGLEDLRCTGKDVSFCAHTILGDAPMVVPDASRDVRFRANALVTGDLGIRYYAGAPIVSKGTGRHLGALCVIDKVARARTTPAQRALIGDLAAMAASLIEEKAASAG